MAASAPTTRPDPDPTVLTTENLRREIENLKELIEARLDAGDAAHDALHKLVSAELSSLEKVTAERFLGVAAQFSERDTRTDQRAGDTKLAVDAAFAAAKEATAKIEAGFTKQIDAMIAIIDTKTSNLSGGLGDIKDRMTALENRTAGINSARIDSRAEGTDTRATLFGMTGIVIGIVAIVIHFIK